jgi:hypothetical protein
MDRCTASAWRCPSPNLHVAHFKKRLNLKQAKEPCRKLPKTKSLQLKEAESLFIKAGQERKLKTKIKRLEQCIDSGRPHGSSVEVRQILEAHCKGWTNRRMSQELLQVRLEMGWCNCRLWI